MKIERRYMAHYLNAGFDGAENYCRLGADLEEYSPELTANVEKKSNILGQTSVTIDGYQKQGEVSPYYAEAGDPLFEKLQEIIDGDLVLDDLKTDIVEAVSYTHLESHLETFRCHTKWCMRLFCPCCKCIPESRSS